MSRNFQGMVQRQRRELTRLLDENETLTVALSVEVSRSAFFETLAEDGGKTLKLIRETLNTPGHEHVFNEHRACALCLKTEQRIRRELEGKANAQRA